MQHTILVVECKNPYIKRKLCDLRNKNVNVQMALATI